MACRHPRHPPSSLETTTHEIATIDPSQPLVTRDFSKKRKKCRFVPFPWLAPRVTQALAMFGYATTPAQAFSLMQRLSKVRALKEEEAPPETYPAVPFSAAEGRKFSRKMQKAAGKVTETRVFTKMQVRGIVAVCKLMWGYVFSAHVAE